MMIVMICYILKDYYIQPFSYFRFEIYSVFHSDNKFRWAQYVIWISEYSSLYSISMSKTFILLLYT